MFSIKRVDYNMRDYNINELVLLKSVNQQGLISNILQILPSWEMDQVYILLMCEGEAKMKTMKHT